MKKVLQLMEAAGRRRDKKAFIKIYLANKVEFPAANRAYARGLRRVK